MIQHAQQRARRDGLDRVTFTQADILDAPFEPDCFDAVVIESVLTITPHEPSQVLDRVVRLLQPGGILAANEGILSGTAPQDMLTSWRDHPAIQRLFDGPGLQSLFEESGIEVIHYSDHWNEQVPGIDKRMAIHDWLRLLLVAYPRLMLAFIRDPRIREAHRHDEATVEAFRKYAGYALIAGRKPARTGAS
jgi:SAM-dependent methyltransferase